MGPLIPKCAREVAMPLSASATFLVSLVAVLLEVGGFLGFLTWHPQLHVHCQASQSVL